MPYDAFIKKIVAIFERCVNTQFFTNSMRTFSSMPNDNLNSFLNLIKGQFSEPERDRIDQDTDLKTLKEWSSLQTMIIVNEIDKVYNVILDFKDIKDAANVAQLFNAVQAKLN